MCRRLCTDKQLCFGDHFNEVIVVARSRTNRNHGVAPPRYRHKVAEHRRLWHIWNGIKKRCLFENDARYHQYGGRGIKMDMSWAESFDYFADWALANGYRDDLTIERIDVNGDYCPDNCTWITIRDQANNKRDTIWVDYHGRRVQLIKICNEKGLKYDAIHNRITVMGWDAEKAIDTPLHTNEGSLLSKCNALGLNYPTVRDRINKLGWTEKEALSTPTGRGRHGRALIHGNMTGICDRCGKKFEKVNGRQKFCSDECRELARKERRRK